MGGRRQQSYLMSLAREDLGAPSATPSVPCDMAGFDLNSGMPLLEPGISQSSRSKPLFLQGHGLCMERTNQD